MPSVDLFVEVAVDAVLDVVEVDGLQGYVDLLPDLDNPAV
jgi:hypothetical protein